MTYLALPTAVLSLCAGGGGLDLGVGLALPGTRTVCYVENEVTAGAVLAQHMEEGDLPSSPIWTDLRTFDGSPWRGKVDLVIGGYPCQPFSNAGKRLGADDPRHLWPAVATIVRDIEPEWCFFENVGAHLRLGFYEVARDLQGMGYRVAATLLTAEEVGAPHRRERLFILAHREGILQREPEHSAGPLSWRDARQDAFGRGDPSDAELADAERSVGGAEPRQQHQERAEVVAGAGGADYAGAVADAYGREHDGREQEPGRRPFNRVAAAGAGGEDDASNVANTGSISGTAASSGRTDRTGRGVTTSAGGVGVWPPGPDDDEGWLAVVAAGRLDLLPATPQPEVRGVADGMGGGLGRPTELHILGNGVVPAQAAAAMHLLLEALCD